MELWAHWSMLDWVRGGACTWEGHSMLSGAGGFIPRDKNAKLRICF